MLTGGRPKENTSVLFASRIFPVAFRIVANQIPKSPLQVSDNFSLFCQAKYHIPCGSPVTMKDHSISTNKHIFYIILVQCKNKISEIIIENIHYSGCFLLEKTVLS